MTGNLPLTCPSCRRADLVVGSEFAGRAVRCVHCDHAFHAPSPADASEVVATTEVAASEAAPILSTELSEARARLLNEVVGRREAEVARDAAKGEAEKALRGQIAAIKARTEAEKRHREELEKLVAERDKWRGQVDGLIGERDYARSDAMMNQNAVQRLEKRLNEVHAALQQANIRTARPQPSQQPSPQVAYSPGSVHEAALEDINVPALGRIRYTPPPEPPKGIKVDSQLPTSPAPPPSPSPTKRPK